MSARTRIIIGLVLMAVGFVWIGQGLGLFPGSGFMDGEIVWATIGSALAVIGILVAVSGWRRSHPPA